MWNRVAKFHYLKNVCKESRNIQRQWKWEIHFLTFEVSSLRAPAGRYTVPDDNDSFNFIPFIAVVKRKIIYFLCPEIRKSRLEILVSVFLESLTDVADTYIPSTDRFMYRLYRFVELLTSFFLTIKVVWTVRFST